MDIITKVLVVDDEPDCSRLVQAILEKNQSFEVKVVNRAHEALAAAREFKPDICVLDVDMPGKDGGELCRELQKDAALGKVPVLFLTGLISKEETRHGYSLRGGMRFLAKPPAPLSLLTSIREVLNEAASARGVSVQ